MKSSATSRRSEKSAARPPARRSSRRAGARPGAGASGSIGAVVGVLLLIAAIGAAAAWWHSRNGYTLYYGDAQAHLAIARRIVDSRTPGAFQIGTVWLPLPHLLMLPFVGNDAWWRNGLAGAFPSTACFALAGAFLFAAVRRLFSSTAAGLAATLVFALNPNLLYLQATPMTEAILFASLMAMLWASVWFTQTGSVAALLVAAAASNAASLTRYEGWFLIPFLAGYFGYASRRDGLRNVLLFAILASLAPLAWLAHNWWWYGDPLEFYRGEWSAKAIYQRSLNQGMERYPGDHDWWKAIVQFTAAARLVSGAALWYVGLAGAVVALAKRRFWAVFFLALPPVFYMLSIHSSGTPIFVPHLWPSSYYNTRYGLALLPLLALGAGALVTLAPKRAGLSAVLVVAAASAPWIAYPRPDAWICWKESEVNSNARRAWTREAADFLRANYRPRDGVFSSFGDLAGIFREAGIPLAEVLHEGNHPAWNAACARPDLFLKETWAVAMAGDPVATAAAKRRRFGARYECVKIVSIRDAPVIEIYRRTNENSFHESPRREE